MNGRRLLADVFHLARPRARTVIRHALSTTTRASATAASTAAATSSLPSAAATATTTAGAGRAFVVVTVVIKFHSFFIEALADFAHVQRSAAAATATPVTSAVIVELVAMLGLMVLLATAVAFPAC